MEDKKIPGQLLGNTQVTDEGLQSPVVHLRGTGGSVGESGDEVPSCSRRARREELAGGPRKEFRLWRGHEKASRIGPHTGDSHESAQTREQKGRRAQEMGKAAYCGRGEGRRASPATVALLLRTGHGHCSRGPLALLQKPTPPGSQNRRTEFRAVEATGILLGGIQGKEGERKAPPTLVLQPPPKPLDVPHATYA